MKSLTSLEKKTLKFKVVLSPYRVSLFLKWNAFPVPNCHSTEEAKTGLEFLGKITSLGIVWDTPTSHSQSARVRATAHKAAAAANNGACANPGGVSSSALHRLGWVWFSKLSSVSRKSTLGPPVLLWATKTQWKVKLCLRELEEIWGEAFPHGRWRLFTLARGHQPMGKSLAFCWLHFISSVCDTSVKKETKTDKMPKTVSTRAKWKPLFWVGAVENRSGKRFHCVFKKLRILLVKRETVATRRRSKGARMIFLLLAFWPANGSSRG